ncbi:MAG: hypothetical protein H6Q89_4444 [Myxococcaceae bacterium]|nr:hypothetical protein [Myxococcaceae bacterium]
MLPSASEVRWTLTTSPFAPPMRSTTPLMVWTAAFRFFSVCWASFESTPGSIATIAPPTWESTVSISARVRASFAGNWMPSSSPRIVLIRVSTSSNCLATSGNRSTALTTESSRFFIIEGALVFAPFDHSTASPSELSTFTPSS